MTTTAVAPFESTYQKSMKWLKDLQELGHYADQAQAYTALHSVMHALRDRLSVDQAAHLSSQLPMLIRGMFFDGWKPSATPQPIRSVDEFFALVNQKASGANNLDVPHAVASVFALLQQEIPGGEVNDVKGNLPKHLQALWPQN